MTDWKFIKEYDDKPNMIDNDREEMIYIDRELCKAILELKEKL